MKLVTSSSTLLRIRNSIHSFFPEFAERAESARKSEFYRRTIAKSGFVVPFPPFIKRSILLRFIIDNECKTLVETGTQYGDTPWAFRDRLEDIYTIELSPRLASLARDRFKKHRNIQIVEGDSGAMIKTILPQLKSKTLFWLDGHYSAGVTAQGALDCPVYAELRSIFEGCPVPWVILIDDARCFGRDKDYPSFEELEAFVKREIPEATIRAEHDIISIVPPGVRTETP